MYMHRGSLSCTVETISTFHCSNCAEIKIRQKEKRGVSRILGGKEWWGRGGGGDLHEMQRPRKAS